MEVESETYREYLRLELPQESARIKEKEISAQVS